MQTSRTSLSVTIFIVLLVALSVGATLYTEPGQIGKVILLNRVVKDFPVTFSHSSHVKERDLPCSTCHTSVFAMEQSDLKITMADFKEGKTCGACHVGGKAFGPSDNCTLCHDVATTEEIDYQNFLIFSHHTHVNEHGFECDACHNSLFAPQVSKPVMTSDELQGHLDKGLLCGACHNGVKTFPHYVY